MSVEGVIPFGNLDSGLQIPASTQSQLKSSTFRSFQAIPHQLSEGESILIGSICPGALDPQCSSLTIQSRCPSCSALANI
jgi:peroxiredoxin